MQEDRGNPPLEIKILLESNPLKSGSLVGRLALHVRTENLAGTTNPAARPACRAAREAVVRTARAYNNDNNDINNHNNNTSNTSNTSI